MQQAIEIGEWLVPHGLRALSTSRGPTGNEATRSVDDVLDVVRAIVERGDFQRASFTVREVQRRDQRRLESADEVRIALDTLVARRTLVSSGTGNRIRYQRAGRLSDQPGEGTNGDGACDSSQTEDASG